MRKLSPLTDLEGARRTVDRIGKSIGNGGCYDRADQEILCSLAERALDEIERLKAVEAMFSRDNVVLQTAAIQYTDEIDRLEKLLDTPEVKDFLRGVQIEAGHQRKRWGEGHDLGKNELEWAGLVSYLVGKTVKAEFEGDRAKAQHHRITAAAALANWHRIVEERHRESGGGEGGGPEAAARDCARSDAERSGSTTDSSVACWMCGGTKVVRCTDGRCGCGSVSPCARCGKCFAGCSKGTGHAGECSV